MDIALILPLRGCGAISGDAFGVVSLYDGDSFVAALILGALACDTSAAWVGVRLSIMSFLIVLHLERAWQDKDDSDGRVLGADLCGGGEGD